MSRPIAYNASGPLSGSIRGGSVNYTVDSGNRDYTTFSSKKWVPSADGVAPIVFVTDTYTQGIELNPSLAVPLFYSCNGTGSAAIIYTANRVPGSPGNYTDANVALNDLITARGYFILESNDPFEGVDADDLVLDVDASKISSYPQTGTNWYDLSGQGNTGALTNGPTFDSNGWLVFDGVDDYSVGPGTLGSDCTVELWISSSNYNGKIPLSIDGNNYGSGPNIYCTGNIIAWNTGDGGNNAFTNSYYPNAQWHHIVITNDYNVTAKLYIDGKLIGTANPLDATTTGANKFWIARFHGDNNYTIAARITAARIYNAALTEAQVKQNYFGSPIVTDGLVFAVDANNIVSYPKSGTAWYNLTGSITSGSLTNGPTFSPANGGSIVFDGTDDYVNYPNSINPTSSFSCEAWINFSNLELPGSDTPILAKWSSSPTSARNFIFGYREVGAQRGISFYLYNSSYTQQDNYRTDWDPIPNKWYHVVGVYSASNFVKIYVDGVEDFSRTSGVYSSLNPDSTQNITSGFATGLSYFPGNIANAKIYNRALSAAEVLQNYQAEQYRFETPAGPVTNGLVLYWDAGNLDSYPGTGTTIYDLSGNGNNGTLYNGVGYNQTNGGVLTFDGVDDYGISYNPNLSTTTSTVMGAARYSGATRGRIINSTDVNWLMGHWNNSTENYYALGWVTPVGIGNSDTNWRIYAALGNQPTDNYALYVNNTVTATSTDGSSGPDGISIGAQTFGGTSEFSTGQFSFVLVYNRILTAAEMTQNYNFFKGRFGL
jgi:hypothetical protein